MFGRAAKPFDRSATLAHANQARAKGKTSAAIAAYRKVLEHTPTDFVVHGKLAPLLVETHQMDDAWKSFLIAGKGQLDDGFADRAIAVYQQAALAFPQSPKIWMTIAELQKGLKRKADAVKVLLQGHEHFLSRKSDWPDAVCMLREALALEPLHVPATIQLSKLLKRSGEKSEALQLLDDLLEQVQGQARRQLLGAQLGLNPGFGALWRWLKG